MDECCTSHEREPVVGMKANHACGIVRCRLEDAKGCDHNCLCSVEKAQDQWILRVSWMRGHQHKVMFME